MISISFNQCCCQHVRKLPILRKFMHMETFLNRRIKSFRGIHTSLSVRQDSGMNIFDRKTKTHQKNIAARYPDQEVYDYLKCSVAENVSDRLCDILRFFPKALDIGAGKGYLSRFVTKDEIGKLYQLESSEEMLKLCGQSEIELENVIGDEEFLPFDEGYFDLIVSSLSMHWVNDLPGLLFQVNRCLKEDGAFVGALFGMDTLYELRCALQLAEIEREAGFGQHVSPFTDLRDLGSLLQRAGLTLPTLDYDEIVINYPSMFELMEDLKGMGENNCTWKRKTILQRESLLAAAAIYKEMYGNDDGSIPATFQVLYLIAWKKSAKQAKPLARGSATTSFRDLEGLAQEIEDAKNK